MKLRAHIAISLIFVNFSCRNFVRGVDGIRNFEEFQNSKLQSHLVSPVGIFNEVCRNLEEFWEKIASSFMWDPFVKFRYSEKATLILENLPLF
jgi:hypothetical protein